MWRCHFTPSERVTNGWIGICMLSRFSKYGDSLEVVREYVSDIEVEFLGFVVGIDNDRIQVIGKNANITKGFTVRDKIEKIRFPDYCQKLNW